MALNQKTIYVYDDFSECGPVLLGCLYVNVIKGGESYSFEYDKEWLKKTKLALTLDPELMPYSGRQYPSGKNIFGLFPWRSQTKGNGSGYKGAALDCEVSVKE